MVEQVSQHVFKPSDLDIAARRPGISAFMRARNSAQFIEATIRSHVEFFDEIVVVYNQCTDATGDILARLEQEFEGKLKVYHYTDRVHPPGSSGHISTPADSPNSMVNYTNTALMLTSRQVVTKLDDDHLAIRDSVARTVADIRAGGNRADEMQCFSGLNLIRAPDSSLAIPARDPVSGNGDIGFFRVSEETIFVHDHRFERFRRTGLKRRFAGFLYWHLKYLKNELGFANYELEQNPQSRYATRKKAFTSADILLWDLPEYMKAKDGKGMLLRLAVPFSDKARFIRERDEAVAGMFGKATLKRALVETTDPALLAPILSGGA